VARLAAATAAVKLHPCAPRRLAYFCQASYPWTDDVLLNFEFHATREDVIAKGERVDTATRALFSRLLRPSK
jgi:hypothetical protein